MAKYTDTVVNAICEMLEKGQVRKTAHTLAGISHECFYEWMKNKPEFKQKVEESERKAIKVLTGKLYELGEQGNMKALTMYLRNRDADSWNVGQKLDVTSDGKAIEFTIVMGKDLASSTDDDES